MLVKNGDLLCRNSQTYEVVCADEKCFVIGEAVFNEDKTHKTVDYEKLEAYSNDETINTLEQLSFIKL